MAKVTVYSKLPISVKFTNPANNHVFELKGMNSHVLDVAPNTPQANIIDEEDWQFVKDKYGDRKSYFDKINGKGEVTDEWVEATKKEIDKIGKGKSKMIREGARPGYHEDGTPKSNDEMSDDEREAFYNNSNFLEEHGQYADRVADVNADSSPLKEKQEAIYKKYAESTGIPMENLMAMVREAKAKLQEADDTPEEKKAKDLEIAAEKAKIAASNKKIQDLNQGRG